MCLDKLDENIKENKDGIYWKAFNRNNKNQLIGDCISPRHSTGFEYYKTNKWYTAKQTTVNMDSGVFGLSGEGGSYESGFHVFKTKKDALEWALPHQKQNIRKVKCKELITRGIFNGKDIPAGEPYDFKILVFKKMLILPNQEKRR